MPPSDQAKPYSLAFEHRPQYLYAYVSGEHESYEISKSFWTDIAERLNETEYDRVLVDEDIEEAPSMMDVFQVVSELPAMGFSGIRIAFHDRKIEHKDLNDFGELVGTNRGLNGRAFNDLDEAEKWLISR